MNNYLLELADSKALEENINRLIKENNFASATVSTYDLEETLLDKAIEDLNTYSFLSSKKVIIIKKIEVIKDEKEIDKLLKYLDNPSSDNLVIVTSGKLNNTLKVTKELKKRLTCIDGKIDVDKFIKDTFKDYTLEPGVVRMLEDYCKDDFTKLSNECSKLKDYAYDTRKITKMDVEDLVVEKLGDSRDLTFSFVRSLAEKNKKEALRKYKELLDYNIEPIMIIGLVASQIRIMYQVKVLEDRKLSTREIADTLKEKEFRITKTKELTRFYSKDELLRLMIELEGIDLRAKSQDVDANFLIDMFIINM